MVDALHQSYLALSRKGPPATEHDHCLNPSAGAE
jgi:hypothetical protein